MLVRVGAPQTREVDQALAALVGVRQVLTPALDRALVPPKRFSCRAERGKGQRESRQRGIRSRGAAARQCPAQAELINTPLQLRCSAINSTASSTAQKQADDSPS